MSKLGDNFNSLNAAVKEIGKKSLRTDKAQPFTELQKQQGRANLGIHEFKILFRSYFASSLRGFTTAGDIAWAVKSGFLHDAAHWAESGPIKDNQHSDLILQLTNLKADVTITFDYLISSETNYDYLTVSANGITELKVSGTAVTLWRTASFSIPFTAAAATILFKYSKDSSQLKGTDKAYIKDVYVYQRPQRFLSPTIRWFNLACDSTISATSSYTALSLSGTITEYNTAKGRGSIRGNIIELNQLNSSSVLNIFLNLSNSNYRVFIRLYTTDNFTSFRTVEMGRKDCMIPILHYKGVGFFVKSNTSTAVSVDYKGLFIKIEEM